MHEFTHGLLNEIKLKSLETSEEIAGVIFKFKELNFFQMDNLSYSKEGEFEIDPKVVLLKDKIHCIFHSHPVSDAAPSVKDKNIFKNHKIPLLIYSCIYDNFVFFNGEKCKPIKV